jgi:nucleoside-diphosphate-sugar epimerase
VLGFRRDCHAVLVTGGTGYVGSHTVAALVERGHEVRVLVRDPRRVTAALTPLGVPATDLGTVVGDVTDPAAVDQALRGCEAVVHAASVYSLDSRDARRIRQVNVRGTDVVLGAAHRAGLDPIVYVSSVVALLQPNGQRLTPDSPPGHPPGPYLESKAEAERVARRHQQAGAPVVITYPAPSTAPTTRTWETGSGGCATFSRAATRSPPRAAIRSWMCATWPRSKPQSWSPAAGPAATWPAAPSCVPPTWSRGSRQ